MLCLQSRWARGCRGLSGLSARSAAVEGSSTALVSAALQRAAASVVRARSATPTSASVCFLCSICSHACKVIFILRRLTKLQLEDCLISVFNCCCCVALQRWAALLAGCTGSVNEEKVVLSAALMSAAGRDATLTAARKAATVPCTPTSTEDSAYRWVQSNVSSRRAAQKMKSMNQAVVHH